MEGQRLYSGVLQLLMWALLLSLSFGVSQTKAESRESLLSCKTSGVFLSLNRTLAPLGRVTSSNDVISYPATDIYNFGYGEGEYIDTWCTFREIDPDPYVELELTSPVLITQILFSGTTNTFGPYYATNLTLEYSPPDNNTILNYYTTEAGRDIKYFAAPDLNTLVQLERPLLTERIRLRPVEWFASAASSVEYICLGVGLYGCLATETATSMGVTSTTVERQSSSPFQSVTTDNSDSEVASQTQTVIRDYQALAIVLPIALLTIAINALLVGVSVYLCVFLRRQRETNRDGKEKVHGCENLEWSSNSNDLTASRYVNTPSKGPISQLLATGHNNAHTYTSARETGYKAVNHNDMHTIHESGTAEEEETMLDNLRDNLAYGKIVSGGEEEMIGFPKLHGQREEAADDVNLKGNESYNAVSYSSAQDDDETGYEAVDHDDMHTIHESGTAEDEETMLDNLAYGKIVGGGEEEMIGFPKLHGQREEAADDVNLKRNESYNAVSYSPVQDDDKIGYEAVDHDDMHTIHESGTAEEEETMLDNLAYGKIVSGGEEEMIGNESYNTVPYSSAQGDEGEYAYPAFSVIPPA